MARLLALALIALSLGAWMLLETSAPSGNDVAHAVDRGSDVPRPTAKAELAAPQSEDGTGKPLVTSQRDPGSSPKPAAVTVAPWSVTARVVRTDEDANGRSPVAIDSMITGISHRFTVRALPEASAPDSFVREEDPRVRLTSTREREWTFRITDASVDRVTLACMLGDVVIDTRTADAENPEVEFRVDAASAIQRTTGSIRFRVMTRREGDQGGPTGQTVRVGMAAGAGAEFSKGAMWPLAEGEWHEYDRIPACRVRLLVRGTGGITADRIVNVPPGQQLDLGTIYTDEPWDFVFFELRDESGELTDLDGSTIDLKTGWKQGGWQDWIEPGRYLSVTRDDYDMAIRVEAAGWSEVPIAIGRDQIHSGDPNQVQELPPIQLTVRRAPTVTWSLDLPSPREHDYVVLRTPEGSPIRIYAANEVQTVVSFLPAGTYRWTHHRDTGVELGRVTGTVNEGGGSLALEM